jgi:hypothetical protein
VAASEAVALFNIPENAARLQAAQNECENFFNLRIFLRFFLEIVTLPTYFLLY